MKFIHFVYNTFIGPLCMRQMSKKQLYKSLQMLKTHGRYKCIFSLTRCNAIAKYYYVGKQT